MLKGFFSASELPVLAPANPETALPQCGACGYYKECKSPKIPPAGKGRKRVLIVSAFPGEDEDKYGKLLKGETSQVLRTAVNKAAGLTLERDCWLANAVICRPSKGTSVESAVDHCRPNLVKTVRELNPEVIITLGSEAVMSLMGWLWKPGEGGAWRWRGFTIPNRKINTWVVPTWHPGFLLRERSPVLDRQFLDDLKRAFALDGRPYPKPVPESLDGRVTVVRSSREAAVRIRNLHKIAFNSSTAVAFDYETTCKKPHGKDSQIVSCALSLGERFSNHTVAYPWDKRTKAATKELLEDPDVGKVGANDKFETAWSLWNGITVRGWKWDCNLNAHVIDGASKVRSITPVDFQAVARLGVGDWASKVTPFLRSDKAGGGYAVNRIKQVPLHDLLLYNGLDALYEHMIANHQRRQLGMPDL